MSGGSTKTRSVNTTRKQSKRIKAANALNAEGWRIMIPAYTTVANGLIDAGERFSKAASQLLVNAIEVSPDFAKELDKRQTISPSSINSTKTNSPLQGLPLYTPSYAEDILTLKQATAAYKASIKAFQAIDESVNTTIKSVR